MRAAYHESQGGLEVLRTDGKGVDVVLDHVGTPVFAASVRSLASEGRFVTWGVTAGHMIDGTVEVDISTTDQHGTQVLRGSAVGWLAAE